MVPSQSLGYLCSHYTSLGLLSDTNYFLMITYHVFPSLSLFPKALYDPSERLYVNSLWYPNTNH